MPTLFQWNLTVRHGVPLGIGIVSGHPKFAEGTDIHTSPILRAEEMDESLVLETAEEAEENLRQFAEKWRKQYPSCVKSWEEHWDVLTAFYEYPPEIRKIICTTNIIEGLNRQFRQIKTSPASPATIPCAGCSIWPLSAS